MPARKHRVKKEQAEADRRAAYKAYRELRDLMFAPGETVTEKHPRWDELRQLRNDAGLGYGSLVEIRLGY